jgi:hypothetical protein
MNKCKKCGSEFTPQKGLVNYCSMECRQSRKRPESVRRKIAESVKRNGYFQSEEWKRNNAEANRSKEKIQKQKQTWVDKRDYESAHMSSLKKWYLEDNQNCERCGISEWNGLPIILEVHHKDSDTTNNTFDNFEALCPNCHSLTEGWRGRK